ncbi:MAG: ATP-dependent helicase, partial [Lachnospiraceae bacterium]|nr:ATP-dependent helicase [Lachnospiraceae bacterium]
LLETNYRCSSQIVEKSLQLIKDNQYRLDKDIKAHHSSNDKVIFAGFPNICEEYEYITEKIERLIKQGIKPREISCIFRTNSGMVPLTETFIRKKIPVSFKESCTGIFQHFVAKDIYHYLKFFYSGRKRKDFVAIMNKPLRYLSRSACRGEVILWEELLEYYKEKEYMKNIIADLRRLEAMFLKLDFYGAVFYLRKAGGYEEYLKEYCKRQQLRWQEVLDILELLQNSLRGVSSLEVWEEQMREYENGLQQGRQTQEGVVLMTMHSCKGLEYPYVFLPDCNEGKIPHTKAISQEEIEEERRMFYVAMTRAIRHLEVLYLEDKKDGYLQKSRFIETLL